MSLSHYEVEVTVRSIDNFNAPIESHTEILTAKSKNEVTAWLKFAKLNRLKTKVDGIQSTNKTPDQTVEGQSNCAQPR